MNQYLSAIDFGSSKVTLAVGRRTYSGIQIVYYRDTPVAGIRNGEIINDLRVVESIRPMLEDASRQIGEPITEAIINVSGKFLHSKDTTSRYARKDAARYIDERDIRQMTAEQFNKAVDGGDNRIFEVIPQRFNIDDQIGVRCDEVVGMGGSIIEGFFKVIYGRQALISRRIKILRDCGLNLRKTCLSSVASAHAVLTRQEMDNGVAVVDIGRGTTDIAIIKGHVVREAAVIPFGGDSITNDIRNVTNTTYEWAEKLKEYYGDCLSEFTPENKLLVLRGADNVEEGNIELTLLTNIIEARMSEIMDAVFYILEKSGYLGKLPAGVVITGGTCYLSHILPLARAILNCKVRLAAPRSSITPDSSLEAMNASSSTAVGLVLEGFDSMLSFEPENKPSLMEAYVDSSAASVPEKPKPAETAPAPAKEKEKEESGMIEISKPGNEEEVRKQLRREDEKKRREEEDQRKREEEYRKREENRRIKEEQEKLRAEQKRIKEEKKQKEREDRKQKGSIFSRARKGLASLFDEDDLT